MHRIRTGDENESHLQKVMHRLCTGYPQVMHRISTTYNTIKSELKTRVAERQTPHARPSISTPKKHNYKRLPHLGTLSNSTSHTKWFLTDQFKIEHHNQNDPNKHWYINVFRLIVSDGLFGDDQHWQYVGRLPNFRWIQQSTMGTNIQLPEHILVETEDLPHMFLPELYEKPTPKKRC